MLFPFLFYLKILSQDQYAYIAESIIKNCLQYLTIEGSYIINEKNAQKVTFQIKFIFFNIIRLLMLVKFIYI